LLDAFALASKYVVVVNSRNPQYSQPSKAAVFEAQSKHTTQHKKPAQPKSRQQRKPEAPSPNTAERKPDRKNSAEGKRGKGACHLCGKKGHFVLDCILLQECKAIIAERNDGDEINAMHVMDDRFDSIVLMNKRDGKHFGRFNVLLDNQGSVSVYKERSMFENIRLS